MEAPETCAVCGLGGRIDPYRDIAPASGWAHDYAHLDCARYRASTVPYLGPINATPRAPSWPEAHYLEVAMESTGGLVGACVRFAALADRAGQVELAEAFERDAVRICRQGVAVARLLGAYAQEIPAAE